MPRAPTRVYAGLLVLSARAGLAEPPAVPPSTGWRGAEVIRQWRSGIEPSPALSVPSPITHDEHIESVMLKDAIALALENNPGIAARRLEPFRQTEGILQAQATFDPTLAGELMQAHSITPNTSALAGRISTVKVDDRSANFHLFK